MNFDENSSSDSDYAANTSSEDKEQKILQHVTPNLSIAPYQYEPVHKNHNGVEAMESDDSSSDNNDSVGPAVDVASDRLENTD